MKRLFVSPEKTTVLGKHFIVYIPVEWGAPKTCGYVIITASRGYLFRKTHESILGAPGIHPWLPRFSEQTTSF
ncbi:MAG: hypothetical protein ABIK68_08640, partial [bacterium]